MIKVRFGRRKEDAGLHPLSEKEIQKKLYGAFTGSIKTTAEETPAAEPRWAGEAPPPKERVAIRKPSSFPWKKVGLALVEIAEAVGGTIKRLLPKLSANWSIGAGIVIALFLGIHTLNIYRATAMKNPKLVAVPPRASEAPAAPKETRPETEAGPSAPVVSPASRKIRTRSQKSSLSITHTPAPKKHYVIQVATYANPGDAQRLSDQMTQAGFQSFVQSATRSGGRTFYLVFLGQYGTSQEAEVQLKEFRNQSLAKDFPDSFIRVL